VLKGVRPLFLLLLACLLMVSQAARAEVLVAAASSIRPPLEALISRYEETSGIVIKVSYGSSGNLTHQIIRGAPFGVFLSADTGFPDKLHKAGLGQGNPVIYARGSLDLYARRDSRCQPESGLQGVVHDLASGDVQHLGIAKPTLAPYGRAAKQAMKNAGVWHKISPNLVFGNNVAQAAQFAITGAVDCVVISHSLAVTAALSAAGRYHPIPQELYTPVLHAMILLANADTETAEFFAFLGTAKASRAFELAGYQPLEE